MAKQKGIDISYWQGNVDFSKVKKDGIQFVILREGYRKTIDENFIDYVTGCKNNGIPVIGVYHFLYSLTEADALAEAKSCVANVKKAGLGKDVIIFADFEYDTVTKAKAKGVTLGKAQCIAHTKTFCEYVESQGYKAGIYTNIDYYKNMYSQDLISKYVFWLAHYTSGNPAYTCDFQQYSSSGKVNGISGNVDMDYYFGSITPTNTTKKTVDELAKEVLSGLWGNGDDRKNNLTNAGYDYNAVQKKVNELVKGTTTTTKKVTTTTKKTTTTTKKATTGVTAQDAINIMNSWVGKSRSAGTHHDIIDLYNSHKPLARGYAVTYSDAYCDTTVSAVFIKLNAVDLIGGTECGVEAHVALFKKAGIWEEDGTVKPEPGWLIVYNWDDNTQPNDGYSDHIGIVEKVSGNTITCIEGNMNGGVVGRRNIPVGYGYIRGYAKPKYATSSSSTNTNPSTKKTVDELAKEVLSGLWGNGDDRKNNLTNAGYDYNAVQNKVNELVKGTTTTTKKVTTTTKKTTTTTKKTSSGAINKTSQWKGVVTASALNVRTWAGTENGKCSFSPLYKGTVIDVCDTVKDKEGTNWYYIKYNNKYGFVSSLYVKKK